jgi:hypothetical protein
VIVGVGNLISALTLMVAGIQIAADHHPILAFCVLIVAIVTGLSAFERDDRGPPSPPQHPLYG